MLRRSAVALTFGLLAMGLLWAGAVQAGGQVARVGVFIVGDPHRAGSNEKEMAMATLLLAMRRQAGIDEDRMAVTTYRFSNPQDAKFARQVLGVPSAEVPFIGLAEVDGQGHPTHFVARYGQVHDASRAAHRVFDQAASMLGVAQVPPGPVPAGPGPLPLEIRTSPDDADMVLIPAGDFYMGSTIVDDERPIHQVFVNAFYLDRYEVTNRQFQKFVDFTHYATDAERKGWSIVFNRGEPHILEGASWQHPNGPGTGIADRGSYPVLHVSWNDAEAYARWASKRLPSEAEWEKAARGVDGRDYPWGSRPDESRSNSRYLQKGDVLRSRIPLDHDNGPLPVGSLPEGASPYGILDMCGNVEEWVEDWYHPYTGNSRPVGQGEGTEKVKRGGGWNDNQLWATYRGHAWPSESTAQCGFRTCRSLLPEDVQLKR